ncbi:MAG: hypothetical protein WCR42_03340 [bacterium]
MLKNLIYFIGVTFLISLISCCPHKIIEKDNVSTNAQNKATSSPDYKQDSITIAYTEKLINEPPITDTKGSLTTDELSKLLPAAYGDYQTRPASSSKMDDDGSIIVVVKGQYVKSDNSIITIDITDYSPRKKVLTPEIYDTKLPEIENFDTKPYFDRGGKGYITWNPVKNMGWMSLLYSGRYNIKIRVHGPSASTDLMVEFLSKIDTQIFKAQ